MQNGNYLYRLWKQLIDHGLSKTDMIHCTNISTNVLARLGKGAPVSMEIMADLHELEMEITAGMAE